VLSDSAFSISYLLASTGRIDQRFSLSITGRAEDAKHRQRRTRTDVDCAAQVSICFEGAVEVTSEDGRLRPEFGRLRLVPDAPA